MPRKLLLTSESVTEGHPDKICDQVSDAILDAVLSEDQKGRVACETMVTTGLVLVAGEISTECYVDIPSVVRSVIREVGYDNPANGFDWESCAVLTSIQEQSSDIAAGVDIGGAGDQGIMYGYACSETDVLMPTPIFLAHRLARRLAEVRKRGELTSLRPDGKTQVTVEYEDGKPLRVHSVVISAQHDPNIPESALKEQLIQHVVRKAVGERLLDSDTKYFVNPTGRFVTGGPRADTGLTGRKIIVDTYGGVGSHGGGCFSGKDPTKVDRSASYAARHIAKNVVASGLADRCEVQLAYVIGTAQPVAVIINTFGANDDEEISKAVRDIYDLSPAGMIKRFDLRRPIYRRTACYGHFGREEEGFTWELKDTATIIRTEVPG
ncbi:MAG: methionine adenosyltransferase [bacterium]